MEVVWRLHIKSENRNGFPKGEEVLGRILSGDGTLGGKWEERLLGGTVIGAWGVNEPSFPGVNARSITVL
jgi:hypothetical protein